ncbi:MAG: hypothetical protein WBP81_35990 [Solirubrobacteraceae bacterium]
MTCLLVPLAHVVALLMQLSSFESGGAIASFGGVPTSPLGGSRRLPVCGIHITQFPVPTAAAAGCREHRTRDARC